MKPCKAWPQLIAAISIFMAQDQLRMLQRCQQTQHGTFMQASSFC